MHENVFHAFFSPLHMVLSIVIKIGNFSKLFFSYFIDYNQVARAQSQHSVFSFLFFSPPKNSVLIIRKFFYVSWVDGWPLCCAFSFRCTTCVFFSCYFLVCADGSSSYWSYSLACMQCLVSFYLLTCHLLLPRLTPYTMPVCSLLAILL